MKQNFSLISFNKYLLIVLILIAAYVNCPAEVCDTSLTVQTITGWGVGTSPTSAKMLRALPIVIRDSILNLTFGQDGAALNILQVQIDPNWDYTLSQWNDSLDADQYWLMSEAKKRGVNNFLAVPWSPPAKFKANGKLVPDSIADTTNYLIPSKYDDYADYLVAYLKGYKVKRGIDINWFSLQNEPDTNKIIISCKFTPSEYNQLLTMVGEKFTQENIKTKILAPNTSGWAKTKNYLESTLADDAAKQYINGVATHNLKIDSCFKTSNIVHSNNIEEIWQTQTNDLKYPFNKLITSSSNYSEEILDALKYTLDFIIATSSGKLTSWFCNDIVGFDSTDHHCLFNYYNDSLKIPKRFYAIEHFSRFVKPGYKFNHLFISGGQGIYIVCFLSEDKDSLVIVGISTGMFPESCTRQIVNLKLPDICTMEYTGYRWLTNIRSNLQYIEPQYSEDAAMGIEQDNFTIFTYIIPMLKSSGYPKVNLISPANNSKMLDTNMTFSWQSAPDANYYNVTVSYDSTFSVITAEGTFYLFDTTVNTTSLKYNGLHPAKTFWWRVRARKWDLPVACSNVWKFATFCFPVDSIRLDRPIDSIPQPINVDSIQFCWTYFSNHQSDNFHIQVSKNLAFVKPDIDTNLHGCFISKKVLTPNSEYWWRVQAFNDAGYGSWTKPWYFRTAGITGVSEPTPTLYQTQGDEIIIFPNPSSQKATIKFDLEQPANVSLKLTDMLGNQISLIDNQFMDSGSHSCDWDASGASAGVYYYVLNCRDTACRVLTGKVVVVK